MKLISEGAEAKIYLSENKIIKKRVSKKYRHKELDNSILKRRIKSENKILKKSKKYGINVPEVYDIDSNSITMENLSGIKLSELLDDIKNKALIKSLAKEIKKLHSFGIIHGDLTTSNIFFYKDKIYLIDFGLGKFSDKIEDKATDIHLLKECLNSRHSINYKKLWLTFIKEYNEPLVLERLRKIESRVRYNRIS
jgi:TP53 regulating kinase-like protein